MPKPPLAIVVLAAGMGTRMRSEKPKVLHQIAGRSLLGHVLDAAEHLTPQHLIVVTGPDSETVRTEAAPHLCVTQQERLGTGHAAREALMPLKGFSGTVLILYGDTPLVTPSSLKRLARACENHSLAVATFTPQDPARYGRVALSPEGGIRAIIEYKDASAQERTISLCNGGLMAARTEVLRPWLAKLSNDNAQGEYYLTDLAHFAYQDAHPAAPIDFPENELLGINTRIELAQAEGLMQTRLREKAMLAGATLLDPQSTYLSFDTDLGQDTIVEPGCFFGPGVHVGAQGHIRANSHLEGCTLGENCIIGPFARLRPGTILERNVKIGNFVETKKASIAQGAKINHLSYIGDASLGTDVNVGAGTITCNYDGYSKYQTKIEEGAFIGSNSALVAPVTIGKNALVAAGSNITQNVPSGAIASTRIPQKNIAGAEARRRTQLNSKESK